MKILVTGGAGFVGTNLIKRLHSDGHDVISFDNYSTGLRDNHIDGVTYIDVDIRHVPKKSKHYWANIDMVYHLAAIARIQPSFDNPMDYFEVNANGTMNIAEVCISNNIPMVYAGSSSKHNGRFKNPYTFSKDVGEDIISLYQQHYGLRASIARFYNVYGPHHLKEGGYCTLIGIWERCIENGNPITIYGDGTKRRDFTHVDDIVDALVMIMEDEAYSLDFELGRGQNHSVKDVADMFKCTDIIYEPDRDGEALNTLCTDDSASIRLGWNPYRNIEDYIKNFIK